MAIEIEASSLSNHKQTKTIMLPTVRQNVGCFCWRLFWLIIVLTVQVESTKGQITEELSPGKSTKHTKLNNLIIYKK